jgi:hypothetical protein
MKAAIATFVFIIYLHTCLLSQYLSRERVTKIKSATVRIIINNGELVGTAFFINTKGDTGT